MFPVILNVILFIGLLVFYWFKRRKIDCGFILVSLYTFVAILGVFLYISEPNEWRLMLWPYLYLFFVFLLFAWPILSNKNINLIEKVEVKSLISLKIICFFYVVFALYFVLFTSSKAWTYLGTNDWLTIRTDIYNDEGPKIYSNTIQWIAYAVIMYCNTFAVVIFFYFLTINKINKIFMSILFAAVILPMISWSIITASRGILLIFFMLLVACYIIFKNGFSNKQKKWILMFSVVFVILIIIYSIIVTISRFRHESQFSSLLTYFGHSFMRFNYGVVDTIREYAGGRIFFKRFYSLLGYNDTMKDLGIHSGNGFITFIGTLYLDWGPLGTLLIALILPFSMNRLFRNTGIAGIYLYIFYLNYLMQGVFVIGNSNSIEWLLTMIIYFILYKTSRKLR